MPSQSFTLKFNVVPENEKKTPLAAGLPYLAAEEADFHSDRRNI